MDQTCHVCGIVETIKYVLWDLSTGSQSLATHHYFPRKPHWMSFSRGSLRAMSRSCGWGPPIRWDPHAWTAHRVR